MNDDPRENKVLTIKEVAELLKVSVQTVKNYIYNGKIKSFKTPGGHHRIMESELNKKLEPLLSAGTSVAEVREEDETKELMDVSELVRAMVKTIEYKENPIYLGHSDRVARWSQLIAQELGLKDEKVKMLKVAGLLHDLGKTKLDDSILSKPGTLTADEYAKMKKHPQFGEEIVKDVEYLQDFAPIIRHHHEWFDGTGYPDGLKGGEIPFDAQIISVAEAFDIISHKFKMNNGKDYVQKTLEELKKAEGIQFSSNLVSVMKNVAMKNT